MRISAAVDPVLEISAITGRVCKQDAGGIALLFEKPSDSSFPVATNLFGSVRRVCAALGVHDLNKLTERMSELLDSAGDIHAGDFWSRIATSTRFLSYKCNRAACHDGDLVAMDVPDLTIFPFLQNWPGDGAASGHGCYMTMAQVVTAAHDDMSQNIGIYRVQIRGSNEVAIQWKPGSGGAAHAAGYLGAGEVMPVAIVLGGEPVTLFSAMFPLPHELDELDFAGFMLGRQLTSAPCLTSQIHVPIGAEVVIEGFITPGETVTEGPFGNHTGFYSPAVEAVLMRVTAIRHRPNAVIPATVVGPPPMENSWMFKAWERLLAAILRKIEPAILDIHFPAEWAFHQSAVIALYSPSTELVAKTAECLWQLEWFAASRLLLFVTDAEPLNLSYASWRAINVMMESEKIILKSCDGRVAIDATGFDDLRELLKKDDDCEACVNQRWQEYGFA